MFKQGDSSSRQKDSGYFSRKVLRQNVSWFFVLTQGKSFLIEVLFKTNKKILCPSKKWHKGFLK